MGRQSKRCCIKQYIADIAVGWFFGTAEKTLAAVMRSAIPSSPSQAESRLKICSDNMGKS